MKKEYQRDKRRILSTIKRKKLEVRSTCDLARILQEMNTSTNVYHEGQTNRESRLQDRVKRFVRGLVKEIPNAQLDILQDEAATESAANDSFKDFEQLMREILLENYRLGKIPFQSGTSYADMRSSLRTCTELVVMVTSEVVADVHKAGGITGASSAILELLEGMKTKQDAHDTIGWNCDGLIPPICCGRLA
jgi:hypothetical protein